MDSILSFIEKLDISNRNKLLVSILSFILPALTYFSLNFTNNFFEEDILKIIILCFGVNFTIIALTVFIQIIISSIGSLLAHKDIEKIYMKSEKIGDEIYKKSTDFFEKYERAEQMDVKAWYSANIKNIFKEIKNVEEVIDEEINLNNERKDKYNPLSKHGQELTEINNKLGETNEELLQKVKESRESQNSVSNYLNGVLDVNSFISFSSSFYLVFGSVLVMISQFVEIYSQKQFITRYLIFYLIIFLFFISISNYRNHKLWIKKMNKQLNSLEKC